MGNRKDRETLKEYFKSGKTPSEANFTDLIDSIPNIEEDGMCRTGKGGMMLFPAKEGGAWAGIYPGDGAETPVWSFALNEKNELLVQNATRQTVLSIGQDNTVSVFGNLNVSRRVFADEFNGTTGMKPGLSEYLKIPADGCWHDLPVESASSENRPGCRIYNIFAGYLDKRQCAYQMARAIAGHCNRENLELTSPQKHWWGWRGPIRFRWDRRGDALFLQMKNKGRKKETTAIYYRMTELWNYTDTEE